MPCPMNGSNLSHVILFRIYFRFNSEFIRYPLDVHGTSNPLLTESAQFADALNVSSRYADRFTTFFPVTFSSFFLIRFSHLHFGTKYVYPFCRIQNHIFNNILPRHIPLLTQCSGSGFRSLLDPDSEAGSIGLKIGQKC